MSSIASPATKRPPSAQSAVPTELTRRRQWLIWRYVYRPGKKKPTKVPHNPATGALAKSTEPSDWSTFAEASTSQHPHDGIGFVFVKGGGLVGIDLDDCIDGTGAIKPWGLEVIDAFGTYAEVSPSGAGVKLWAKGKLPADGTRRKYEDGEIELYDWGRYFTVTGDRWHSAPPAVNEAQAQIEALYKKLVPPKEVPKSAPASATLADQAIIEKLLSEPGPKAKRLWLGNIDDYTSPSEADAALCCKISFYSRDPAQIERVFGMSALANEKWTGRPDYRERTVASALEIVTDTYRPARSDSGAKVESAPADKTTEAPADSDSRTNAKAEPTPPPRPPAPPPPLVLADDLLDRRFTDQDGRRLLVRWAGAWYRFDGAAYRVLADEALDEITYRHLETVRNRKGKRLRVTAAMVREIRLALPSRGIRLDDTITPPVYLDNTATLDPLSVVPVANGLLELATDKLHAPTPELFALNSLPVEWEPDAPDPEVWLRLLNDYWLDDAPSVWTLQRWVGYCLTPDTRQQKALLIVGPKRSGKGTIGRVLAALLGAANVVAPTLASMTGSFGLSPLLGKLLATVSDARLSGRTDQAVVVERILSVTGEDQVTVDRKHRDAVTCTLRTRFLILTNELPRLADASGAFASRFIVLRLVRSFYGHEDHGLLDRLLCELPGILKWAVEGWRELHEAGRFQQPESAAEAIAELEALGSPVKAFTDECCIVEPGASVPVVDLFAAWREWCAKHGREHPGDRATFGRNLRATLPALRVTQPRDADGRQYRVYEGIRLAPDTG